MGVHLCLSILAGGALSLVAATLFAGVVARLGFPLPPTERRIGCIDGLRGYLALSVLIHHFAVWTLVTRFGRRWTILPVPLLDELGAGAVALFFMTTGLVFYPRVLDGFRATAWPAVAVTRLFRIVPLVVVSVLFVLALVAVRTGRPPDGALPGAFLQWVSSWSEPPLLGYPDSGRLNAHVLWSLWYEWVFYLLVLPACALARDVTRGRLPSWTVPLALLAGSRLLLRGHPLPVAPCLSMFAAGMIAFEVRRRAGWAEALRSRPAALVALAGVGAAAVHYAAPSGLVPLLLFGFFFTCVACGNDLFGLLRTGGALVMGECSFGIYLLHGLLLSLFFVDAGGITAPVSTGWLPLFLPLVALAAALVTPLTHLAIERPMIRRGAAIARRWTGRRPRATEQELELAP